MEVRCPDRHPLQNRESAEERSSQAAWQSQRHPQEPQRGSRERTLRRRALTGSASHTATVLRLTRTAADVTLQSTGSASDPTHFRQPVNRPRACTSPQGHAVLTSSSNEGTARSLRLQAANIGRALLKVMKKQLGFVLFGEGEGSGVVVPKHQCQPDNPAGYWQLQEEVKVAHTTPDLQQPASTSQPVFQKCFIL